MLSINLSHNFFPQYNGNYRMKIFERSDFAGQNMELMDDCPDLNERFHTRDISSVNVMEGYWILHEHPHYRGRQYFLRPGEYRRHSEWGSTSPTFGSLRRVTELNWFLASFLFYPYWASLLSFHHLVPFNGNTVSVWSQHCGVQTWNHAF